MATLILPRPNNSRSWRLATLAFWRKYSWIASATKPLPQGRDRSRHRGARLRVQGGHAGLDRLWQPRSGQSTLAIGPNRAVILKEQITISA
jgi:hypothetical protein